MYCLWSPLTEKWYAGYMRLHATQKWVFFSREMAEEINDKQFGGEGKVINASEVLK